MYLFACFLLVQSTSTPNCIDEKRKETWNLEKQSYFVWSLCFHKTTKGKKYSQPCKIEKKTVL